MKGYLNTAPMEGSDTNRMDLPPAPGGEEEEVVQAEPGMMEEEPPPEEGEEGEEETNVTEDEQAAYDQVVSLAKGIMYAEDTSPAVVDQLRAKAEDPIMAIVDATTLLITQIDQKTGNKVPDTVIIPAGVEVAADLLELGEEGGIFEPISDDDKAALVQEVVASLLEEYGETPESIQSELANLTQDNPELAQLLQGFGGGGNGQAA